MNKREIRFCEKHGETEFGLYKNGDQYRWRCLKCMTEATQKRREKIKQMAINYKGNKCCICGYDKCNSALEFHHINSEEKEFGIASNGYTRSWEQIQEELNKCILVCANCHREIHAGIVNIDNYEQLIEETTNKNFKTEEFESCTNTNNLKKYKFTLEEVEAKRLECNNWQEVADFYGISLATLKRHRKELQN